MKRRVLIISSCTGEKSVSSDKQLTQSDFKKGKAHLKKREQELAEYLTQAAKLYSGQQHVRLMRGIETIASQRPPELDISLYILSAAYGLVRANRKLAPYEVTFSGMRKTALREWADELNIPRAFRKALSAPYDLGLILLGGSYLEACDLPTDITVGGPTLFFCSASRAKKIPSSSSIRAVPLTNEHAKRFSCGLVGLKGEVTSRLLDTILAKPTVITTISKPGTDVLKLIEASSGVATPKRARQQATVNPKVDRVIKLPKTWINKPHREKLQYFIPEWDDLVDPDYDFENDAHSGGTGDWSNQVYSHQLYSEPSYDGILVSRAVAEKSKKKAARINELGVHRFLRVPRHFPMMGDCGAFDYIKEKSPPYTTNDVLDYYTKLDFDFGVSVDHLVVPAFEEEKQYRYELTIENADVFLREHRRRGLEWEPIGAVQGWDIRSYTDAARKCAHMGYSYIALGGLVRSQTPEIIATVASVRQAIPTTTRIHVLGFSRFDAIGALAAAGANSIDSASMLRKAWLGSDKNYLTTDGWYSAIRIPQANASFRAKNVVKEGKVTLSDLEKLEKNCLEGLRRFSRQSNQPTTALINLLVEYDVLIAGERPDTKEKIERTLCDRPWQKCLCKICQESGIEVIIFRGNNRNRRRGFHNTYVFYQSLQRILSGYSSLFHQSASVEDLDQDQIQLFEPRQELD